MDLFDKVKEKTSSALEQGKELAHTQQLKLHLRKLEGELDEANAAFGAAAFDLLGGRHALDEQRPRCARDARPRGAGGPRGQEGRDHAGRRGRRG